MRKEVYFDLFTIIKKDGHSHADDLEDFNIWEALSKTNYYAWYLFEQQNGVTKRWAVKRGYECKKVTVAFEMDEGKT